MENSTAGIDTALVIEATQRALPPPPGVSKSPPARSNAEKLLIHTDQGSQYRATTTANLLEKTRDGAHASPRALLGQRGGGELLSTLKFELNLDDDRKDLLPTQQLQRSGLLIDGLTTTVKSAAIPNDQLPRSDRITSKQFFTTAPTLVSVNS